MDEDVRLYAPIEKYDEEKRLVYGYASTEALDSQGEVVKKEAMAAAIDDYMQFANIREMHQPSAVGRTQKAVVDSKGTYIVAKVVDDIAWEKVKEKVYNGFSIGGKVNTKKGHEITDLSLSEISLVDRPANPECTIELWKRDSSEDLSKKKFKVKDEHTIETKETPGTKEITVHDAVVTQETDLPKESGNKVETVVAKEPDPKESGNKTEVVEAKADKAEDIKKCMGCVGQLAEMVTRLKGLAENEKWEDLMEGEGPSDIATRMEQAVAILGGILKDHVAEEVDEIVSDTNKDQPAPSTDIYAAEKPADLQKIDDCIAKSKMPSDDEIVKMLVAMDIDPVQKAIDASKWEIAGRIMTKLKKEQNNLLEKGDDKKETPTTEPQTKKADTKLEVVKTDMGTKDQSHVAKLEAELSALKGEVQKLLDTPVPLKVKSTFVTLEKGHEPDPNGSQDELAIKEKRSLELQARFQKGTYTPQEVKEAEILSLEIMKLRREQLQKA